MPTSLPSMVIAFVCCATLSSVHASRSDSQKAMEFFHATCIQSASNNYAGIENMVKVFEGTPMSEKVIGSDPVLSQMDGKGYWVNYEGLTLGVAYVINGGCTVILPKLKPALMQEKLKMNYPLRLIHTETTGPQVEANFRIESPSIYSGSIIKIIYAKPEMKTEAGTLGYIPVSALKAKSPESHRFSRQSSR